MSWTDLVTIAPFGLAVLLAVAVLVVDIARPGNRGAILGVAVLTSKGASGVQGAAFIALVATMMVIPTIPVAGMALILGIDRFLSMCRAVVNMTGNAVATLVVARWENELDRDTLRKNLAAEESG